LFGIQAICGICEEIQYQGHPVSYWLAHWTRDSRDGPHSPEADEAFRQMGTNALPFLIEVLGRNPSPNDETAIKVYLEARKLHEQQGAQSASAAAHNAWQREFELENQRLKAAALIGRLGPAGAPAIPELMRILRSTNGPYTDEVLSALIAMGDKTVDYLPEFINYLHSSNFSECLTGAMLLEGIGPKARPAIPALQAIVNGESPFAQAHAAIALWKIDRQTNVALRVFTNLCESSDDGTRELGTIYLGEMGQTTQAAWPFLQALLKDPNQEVRRQAEQALQKIDPDLLLAANREMNSNSAAQVAHLIAQIRGDDLRVAERALEVIKVYGPDASAAVPALTDILRGKGFDLSEPVSVLTTAGARIVLMDAIDALGEIGPDAQTAVPSLIELRRGFPAWVFFALGNIGPGAHQAVPVLMESLSNKDPYVCCAAADSLTRIAPREDKNLIAILRTLQQPPFKGEGPPMFYQEHTLSSNYFHAAATVSLWRLGLEPKPPVMEIVRDLEEGYGMPPRNWLHLLGEIGPPAKAALPNLEKRLNTIDSVSERRDIAITIRKIDPQEAAKLELPGSLGVP
jgi:HEAT repeat protein